MTMFTEGHDSDACRGVQGDSYGRGLLNKKLSNNYIPIAPPFVGSETEVDQILTRKAKDGTSCLANPSGSASATTKESRSTTTSSGSARSASVFEVHASPIPSPARLPTFHASGLDIWSAVVSYDACCRLCIHSLTRGHCMEVSYFLNDDCAALREAFGLRKVLLRSEEELLEKGSPELVSEEAAPKSRKTCSAIAETVAYDFVLEVAMKVQHIKQRNLLLRGQWKWLVNEFASLYGVSDTYTKLRYLSHVMDVATPTDDCLALVHDLLLPVIMKSKNDLSHQENRMLREIDDKVQQMITLVFENYKSLDESLPSGMMDVLKPATGMVAPVLLSALKLYSLLHDISSAEAKSKLCRYFQAAAKKRSSGHLIETNELILSSDGSTLMDLVTLTTSYRKMTSLICNIRNEILADFEIDNQHVLPSFIDLPNISSAIYCWDLCRRLRAFLVACPPPSLLPPVAELVIATIDFQRDLACWNINPVKGGVDAKELFQGYINIWIQELRLTLLRFCKLYKVNWSGVRNQHSTNAFVQGMYDWLKKMMDEYEVIIFHWPEYIHHLEKAIADIEKAIFKALERQYADVLTPLKDNLTSKVYGLKYFQKIAKRSDTYVIPDELGNILNSMRRMLEILKPEIETKLNSWRSCIPNYRDTTREDCFGEVTEMLRAKFRSYLHAIVEKLAENTRLQRETKLKNIIQNLTENVEESDVQNRMQPLKNMLLWTMDHLHTIVEPHVLIAICRGFWDRMGQDILLCFLENRRESKSYKGLRFTVSILEDEFAKEMQKFLGNALQEKNLEPPPNIREVHSLLYKNASINKDWVFSFDSMQWTTDEKTDS